MGFLAALSVSFGLAIPAYPDPMPEPGFISGRVIGFDGKPIPKATVTFSDPYPLSPKPAVSSDDGRFKLGPLPPSARPHRGLVVDAEGLAREFVFAPPVLPGFTSEAGDIVISYGRRYSGTVVDDQGQPVVGVRVKCELLRLSKRDAMYYIGRPIETVTVPGGQYHLPPLPIGRHSLRFEAPGKATTLSNVHVEPGPPGTVLQVRMANEVPFKGRVLDEDGKPLAGATIGRYEFSVKSDADGRFSINGLGSPQRNAFEVSVDAPGFMSGSVQAPSEAPVEIKLKRHGWFAGRAVDAETGKPVTLASAWFAGPKAPGKAPQSQYARLDQPEPGSFRVAFYAEGEYSVTVNAPDYEPKEFSPPKADARKTFDVGVIKMKRLPVVDRPKREVAGTATREGKPIARGWAVLYRSGPQPYRFATDLLHNRVTTYSPLVYAQGEVRDGRFALEVNDDAKDWYAAVYEPGRAPTIIGPLEVPLSKKPTAVAVAAANSGGVTGRVADPEEKWAGHLWVVAFAKNGHRAEARVMSDGKFAFPALPPGEYGLKVGHDLFHDSELEAEDLPIGQRSLADPWNRATLVTVEPGKVKDLKDLALPQR
ncbi:MAG: carboxypeptidase-like regulatory domain-containing protein [Gemmataceae bacterium]